MRREEIENVTVAIVGLRGTNANDFVVTSVINVFIKISIELELSVVWAIYHRNTSKRRAGPGRSSDLSRRGLHHAFNYCVNYRRVGGCLLLQSETSWPCKETGVGDRCHLVFSLT